MKVWYRQLLLLNLHFLESLFNRGGVTRRKITREDKMLPSDAEILSIMKTGQDRYTKGNYTPCTCFNFDETAFTWAIGSTHCYCPGNQGRATNIGFSNSELIKIPILYLKIRYLLLFVDYQDSSSVWDQLPM